jgi:hypothetical protein
MVDLLQHKTLILLHTYCDGFPDLRHRAHLRFLSAHIVEERKRNRPILPTAEYTGA